VSVVALIQSEAGVDRRFGMPMSPEHAEQMRQGFCDAGLTVFERGWLSSNNVLFRSPLDGKNVLVDTGYCTHAEQTVLLVRDALGSERLDLIINTHLHSDHCGGNQALQRAFGSPIDVPAGEMDNVDSWDEERLSFRATSQQCPRFTRAGALATGDSLELGGRAWQVIASPGHDPHSVMLHQPELHLLISADALWENGFGVVFPELEGMNAFEELASTLDVIETLGVAWVIPGHGAPFGDVSAALARARSRLKSFAENPERHARYAAKVLVKFQLLESRILTMEALHAWMKSTPYLVLLHKTHFLRQSFPDWADAVVRDLIAAGAARRDGSHVSDA
jgi:glyoxylase-like metal-dependent hydrolase (beta-lactamase superfamily II)